MYINFWYPVILAAELTDKPVRVKMLGCDFVAFRDTKGAAQVMSNICVHRGASLSNGKIKGDAIECPYHGWQFRGGDGVCTKIPSLGNDAKLPSRAKVDAYPVQEKYGIIFAFLGDLPENERPPIQDVPEYGKEGWKSQLQNYQWEANFQRAVENTLDPAHTEFVHPSMGYGGGREDYNVPDLRVVDEDWGTGTMTVFTSPDLPDSKMKGVKGAGKMEAGAGSHGPSQTWTKLHFSPMAWAHQYGFSCPVDEKHINRFFLQARNFKTEDAVDVAFNARNNDVMLQDKAVVERIVPMFSPESSTEEVLVKADAVISRYREYLKEWERRGWRIDVDAMNAQKDKKAFAIPSPARRTSKGWAVETVPLIAPASAEKAAAE